MLHQVRKECQYSYCQFTRIDASCNQGIFTELYKLCKWVWSSEAGCFFSPSESPIQIPFYDARSRKSSYQVSETLKLVAYVLLSADVHPEAYSVQVACVLWFQIAHLPFFFFLRSAFNLCPVKRWFCLFKLL